MSKRNVHKINEPIMAPNYLKTDGTEVGGGGAEPTDSPTGAPTGVTHEDSASAVQKLVITMTDMAINIPAATDRGGTVIANMGDRFVDILGINVNLTMTRDGTNIVASSNITAALGRAINSAFPMSADGRDLVQQIVLSDDTLVSEAMNLGTPSSSQGTPISEYPIHCERNQDIYLNAGASNTGSDDDLLVNGTVEIIYIDLGDGASNDA